MRPSSSCTITVALAPTSSDTFPTPSVVDDDFYLFFLSNDSLSLTSKPFYKTSRHTAITPYSNNSSRSRSGSPRRPQSVPSPLATISPHGRSPSPQQRRCPLPQHTMPCRCCHPISPFAASTSCCWQRRVGYPPSLIVATTSVDLAMTAALVSLPRQRSTTPFSIAISISPPQLQPQQQGLPTNRYPQPPLPLPPLHPLLPASLS
ncbi:hypothetical protein B296_00027396 [Ensete ventricosum]|uniref:Uncharacterized protein n=1 Tax=Ensete ventricosum TaxID=4639 RepID=A0A426ZQA5_ENSVE|nr:hypothetical protein B296_00027396 [Ensete ventricosum]